MATNSTTAKLSFKVASLILRLLLNIFFYIIVIILTIQISKAAFDFTYQLFGPVTMEKSPGTEVTFQIRDGESTMVVAGKLENSLLVKNKYAFYLKTKLQESVLMPGTYTLNTSMTYDQILKQITDYSASVKPEENNKNTGTASDTDSE